MSCDRFRPDDEGPLQPVVLRRARDHDYGDILTFDAGGIGNQWEVEVDYTHGCVQR